MPKKRPGKFIRLNFVSQGNAAMVAVLGDPNEVRISGSVRSFISVKEDGISIAAGMPSKISIQGLPGTFVYGTMIKDLPFPMGLIPGMLPKQVWVPPMAELLSTVRELSVLSSMFVGV